MGSRGTTQASAGTMTVQAQTQAQAPTQVPQPNVVFSTQQAQSANNSTFSDTDNRPFHELRGGRQYYQNQTFDIDTLHALNNYLDNQALNDTPEGRQLLRSDPNLNGMYSISQNLNYLEKNNLPLSPAFQAVSDSINNGMHNLGENLTLQHYGRMGMVNDISSFVTGGRVNSGNYESFTESDLRQMMVGKSFNINQLLSTSHNNFKNAPGNVFSDKVCKLSINAKAGTQALMPGNGPGGALGEIILQKGQTYKITDVKFTGQMGRSQASYNKQIEFVLEVV